MVTVERADAWRELEKRRTLFWVIFVGFVPGVPFVSTVLSAFAGVDLFLPVGLPWLLAFAVAGLYQSRLPCPQCAQPFGFSWTQRCPFTNKCLHCGLQRDSQL
jgi:hypothetical protein